MEIQSRNFWNPVLETLDRERLVELELKNFRKYMAYAKKNSLLYQKKLKGIDPKQIQTKKDLLKLPLTDKEDLRLAQISEDPTIYGDLLGIDPVYISDFRQTSGTTGKPVYVPESYESWQWRVEVWCHILWMAGFRETDRVFIPFGYNVYVAFWEGHYAAQKIGCEVVPGGALDTKGRLNKIREIKATALLNTPTYGLHMAQVAKKMGITAKDLGIKRMQCAGEPLPQATRKMLEKNWNAEVYDHIGGTEPCAWAAMCSDRNGLHIMEPFFLVEILDMETRTREVEEGELGVAVVTPLGRHSFPLVRFNTNDVVRKSKSGCSCGRTSMKISGVEGRMDDLTKIRGVLFTPVAVEEVLRKRFPVIIEYEIIVQKKGIMDEINLRLEPEQELGLEKQRELESKVREKLKMRTNLRFNIQFEKPGVLPRYTLKSKRFKDLRGL
ncbi:MAG: AMP-binding protein [Desulfobacula sp.]|jgi:phenylacetate-CoA ligase|nr:AMP-binding protein [Desulfobacula sp.]MBT6338645.1 AMP-binding protein [Desulfobacula sp.]